MNVVNILRQSSEEIIKKTTRKLGLTELETRAYIFLAKCGPLKGGEIARNLKMPKSQIYNVLKKLQSKGWAHSTMEFPARFSAVSLAEILDSQIKLKREEAQLIESTKKDVLSHWSSVHRDEEDEVPEKFVVISGLNKIFVKIFQMIEGAEGEIRVLMSGRPLVQTINAGTPGVLFKKLRKSKVKTKILSQVSADNVEIISKGIARASRQGVKDSIEFRHLTDSSFYCRFTVKDDDAAVLFLTPRSVADLSKNAEDTALWTTSKAVVTALRAFFDELWSGASDASEKLKELSSNNSHI